MSLISLASHTVDLDAVPERPVVLDIGRRGFDFPEYEPMPDLRNQLYSTYDTGISPGHMANLEPSSHESD